MPVLLNASKRPPFVVAVMLLAFASGYYFLSPVDTQALNKNAAIVSETNSARSTVTSYSKAGSYLAARFARQTAQQGDAASLLLEALSHDPRNLDLRRDTVRQLIIAGNTQEAIKQVNKIPAMVHTHPLTRLVMLMSYMEKEEIERASTLLKAHKADGVLGLLEPVAQQWLALAMGDKTLLPMMQEDLEVKQTGYADKLIRYHMGLLNHAAAYDDVAHQQLQSATAELGSVPARMVYNYINFLKQTNKQAVAEAMLTRYHQRFTNSHHIPATFAAWDDVVEVHTLPSNAREGLAEILFSVGNVLFSTNNAEDTQFYLQLSLFLRPDFAPAQILLARIAETLNAHQQAIAHYRSVHPESLYAHQAAREIFINTYHSGDVEASELEFKQLEERFTPNESDWFAYGNMKRSEASHEEAVAAYDKAINAAALKKKKMWQLYFARGASYEQMNQWKRAEADLMQALALAPNQPDVLNYLGYSWAEQGNNLEKAREYIVRALRLAPNAGHIVDSMGWVEYRRGEFEQAVKYLEHAAILTPNDPTVNDHLGDALYRVGRKEEARFQWMRAIELAPEEKLLLSLEEKLVHGLGTFTATPVPEESKAAKAGAETPAIQ